MKKFLVQALALSFCIACAGTVFAQGTLTGATGAGTGVDAGVTKKITCGNDVLNVDIKQGSIKYEFYATMADGSVTMVKSGTQVEPTDKTSVNDLALSKTNSKQVTLVLTAACDACAAVTPQPDGVSSAQFSKELISSSDVAVVDVKAATKVDYELWTKKTPFSDFEKDTKQSGTLAPPKDLSLANDIVLSSPDSYEIKVVVTTAAGDSSAVVSFKDK